MSNRIDTRFRSLRDAGRSALIPFVTAGDPNPEWTADIMHALVSAGADLVELGVPFSDPMADGPIIQAASERAIARGVSLSSVLEAVRRFRADDATTPVVLMGYMNPLERYGHERFAADAAAAGVDGMLLVDCPPEELGSLGDRLQRSGIHPICLVAPTTRPDRLERIGHNARGYLYYVSFKGITGANRLDQEGLVEPVAALRRLSRVPVAVGFGIKDPAAAAAVAAIADGVVIGSALVQALTPARSADEAADRARAFLAPVRAAMDNGAA